MAVATVDSPPPPQKRGTSLVVQVGVLLVLTLLAVGGGWFAGAYLKKGEPTPQAEVVKVVVEAMTPGMEGEGESGHGGGHGAAKEEADGGDVKLIPRLVPLEPVTTNLAAPSSIWVRMELSVIFASPPPPEMPRIIHQDMLAYMRTVTLQQIEGASGFQHLKTDLEERARIRSGGLATQIMIRTLLFE